MNHIYKPTNLDRKSRVDIVSNKTSRKLEMARYMAIPIIDLKDVEPNTMVFSNADGIFHKMTISMDGKFNVKQLNESSDIQENWPSISELGYGKHCHSIIEFLACKWDCSEDWVIGYLKQYRGD